MERQNEKNNKIIFGLAVIIIMLLVGTAISIYIHYRDVSEIERYSDNQFDKHYAFIYTSGDSDFWDKVYEGAREKGKELGVLVEDFGSNLTVDYDRNELIRIAMDAGVDGIIVDADSYKNTAELINEVTEKGIPVVTVVDDCANSQRVCFVGISAYTMGLQYGEELIKMVGNDALDVYVILDQNQVENSQNLVISAIFDTFENNGLGEKINIEGVYVKGNNAFSAEEQIRDIFISNQLPDVVISLDAVYTRCLFQAAVDYNKVGDVKIFGFHDSEDILDAVAKNIVEATISIDAKQMGKYSVEAMDEYVNTGYVSSYISQESEMVKRDMAERILENKDAADK